MQVLTSTWKKNGRPKWPGLWLFTPELYPEILEQHCLTNITGCRDKCKTRQVHNVIKYTRTFWFQIYVTNRWDEYVRCLTCYHDSSPCISIVKLSLATWRLFPIKPPERRLMKLKLTLVIVAAQKCLLSADQDVNILMALLDSQRTSTLHRSL